MEDLKNNIPIITTNLIITHDKNGLPMIQIRKSSTETETIKFLIKCAFHEQPIVILPKFTDKLKSLQTLIDKGILYKEQEQYYFTL